MLAYDKKWLIRCLVGLAGMCLAMKLTGGTAFLLIFPLLLVAFGKNRSELLLFCLLMTIAVTIANGNVVPKSMIFGLAARSVHFLIAVVMVLQLVAQRNSRLLTPTLSILLYIAYMAVVSSQGWQPLISYLKLLLFTVMFLGFYSVANAAATRQGVDARKVRSVMLSFAAFFVLGSMALLPFPGISMMNAAQIIASGGVVPEGSLFMGMTLHSQTLGPIIAILGTLILADLLFSIGRWDKFYVLLLLCAPILIYKSASRTAMGTYLAGVSFAAFLFMMAHGVGARWKNRALSSLTLVGVLAGIALFSTPQMRQGVAKFVLKYTSEDSGYDITMEEVMMTRQGSIDGQIESFKESPMIGNGFQVSRQLAMREYTSWNQLLSAPIEKGVWVTAVLEEGGVFGMLLFLIFLMVSFFALLARRAYIGLSVLFAIVVCNLGEFTFFAMTSTGGLCWAMLLVGLALDANRQNVNVFGMRWRFQGMRDPALEGGWR